MTNIRTNWINAKWSIEESFES